MSTEQIDPRYAGLDSWSTAEMLAVMYEGQLAAAAAVQPALEAIGRAVQDSAAALKHEGRLAYVGAGTSGRIGVQDGTELCPTFNWPAERLLFLIAGGTAALTRSAEAAEDSEPDGAKAIIEATIESHDVVIGLAASGTTPFVLGALRAAQQAGAVTVGIANNPGAPLLGLVRHPVLLRTGSEAIAGSTRMKAATAQKIALNLFSTALMVKLGRVYSGLMVHMRATNAKLKRRAVVIVSDVTGCAAGDGVRFVEEAEGDVKIAILLALGRTRSEAAALLERADGNLRVAIDDIRSGKHD
ncbi:MAG TPA: N-acetylmuramic acid 6-phosphate etherase [Rhizomicrobium sp.]|jgi:N-acetylmuramic acid 6-phosphate etherase|nr:N-acetylmuramic acid 6-phosphate etherase [Rhizomicrobium sp.]